MHRAYVSLGSNEGDRKRNLSRACDEIDLIDHTTVTRRSSLYETEPVDCSASSPWFVNQVLEINTLFDPEDFFRHLQMIEAGMGRKRTLRNAPREIDLDLIFFDSLTVNRPDLTIPHPRYSKRAFVLLPLSELAPDLRDPVTGLTVAECLEQVEDTSVVKKLRAEHNSNQ